MSGEGGGVRTEQFMMIPHFEPISHKRCGNGSQKLNLYVCIYLATLRNYSLITKINRLQGILKWKKYFILYYIIFILLLYFYIEKCTYGKMWMFYFLIPLNLQIFKRIFKCDFFFH